MQEMTSTPNSINDLKTAFCNACQHGINENLMLMLITLTLEEVTFLARNISIAKYQTVLNQLFMYLVKNDHPYCLKLFKPLMMLGTDINTTDESEFTPLTWAINNGNLLLINEILRYPVKIDKTDIYGYSAFHYACFTPHDEIAYKVLDKLTAATLCQSCNDKSEENTHYSLFHFICEHANKDRVLHIVRQLSTEMVNALKQLACPRNWQPKALNALFIDAAKNFSIEFPGENQALALFLALGADIDATDDGSFTALHWAAINGNMNVIKFLCSHHADINKTDMSGYTALDLAYFTQQKQVIEQLKACGAKSAYHETPAKCKESTTKRAYSNIAYAQSYDVLTISEERQQRMHHSSFYFFYHQDTQKNQANYRNQRPSKKKHFTPPTNATFIKR